MFKINRKVNTTKPVLQCSHVQLYSISVHKFFYMEFITVKESKFDVKYVNTIKSTTYKVRVFKSNRMSGTKHSKTNRLQKNIEY